MAKSKTLGSYLLKQARRDKALNKLPKDPEVGEEHTILTKRKRLVTFKCMKKKGFGMWRVVRNEAYE